MHQTLTATAPVQQKDRIILLDSLRGIAILGILLMNIPSFSLPGDPWIRNESGTIDYKVWFTVEWLFSGTQRALFSMLFGAGILLFIGRKETRLDGLQPADYFFRRQLWLMVFSLFDVFILLWPGDILMDYACLGMIMFAFRKLPPRKLIIGAIICLLLMTLRDNRNLYLDKEKIHKGEKIAAIDTTATKLSFMQKEDLQAMQQIKDRSKPENRLKRIDRATNIMHSDYGHIYEFRITRYLDELVSYLFLSLWDVLLFMFLGMAFFKMGILTGQASTRTYLWLCIIGLGLGLLVSYTFTKSFTKYNFNYFEYAKHTYIDYYQFGRALRSVGLFGLVMLLYKSGWFKWLFAMLRPVGQMAFTNYLMQSLICGIIFYGIGFGLYNRLHRHEIYYVVGAIWVLQIIYSNIWLRYFLYGPFEWAWRSLTYWKKQPFLKVQDTGNKAQE